MTEIEKETQTKEQEGGNAQEGGDKPQELSPIERANAAAERLEKANAKQEELLKRQEELEAERRLSGKATIEQEKPKEETPEEYRERIRNNKF